MIKRDMVRERLSLIQDAASILDNLSALPLPQFVSDIRNPATAESYLRRALEAVFDVGRHLLAASGQVSLASEYKSIARGLGQQGIVTADLASRLEMMAGYRNRLVHLYAQVTPHELHTIISEDTDDLKVFVRSIEVWLSAHPKS
jgi:uncharacterized protein YutE (UPF0331/DUF86 family)